MTPVKKKGRGRPKIALRARSLWHQRVYGVRELDEEPALCFHHDCPSGLELKRAPLKRTARSLYADARRVSFVCVRRPSVVST